MAILDRDVLDDRLIVLLIVPFATEVLRVVVWDKVRVSVLVHHWDKLRFKRLNIVDYDLLLIYFRVLFLYRLMDTRMRWLVEWSNILNVWLFMRNLLVVCHWHLVWVWTLQKRCLNLNKMFSHDLAVVMDCISTLT